MTSRVLTYIAMASAAVALAACETEAPPPPALPVRPAPPPPPPPPPTPAEEFAWSTAKGSNSLFVNVAYQPAATQTWHCTGQAMALMPETAYSRARIMTLYGSTERAIRSTADVRARSAANPDSESGRFVRSTTCDANDNFNFTGLPDGAYFIVAPVHQVKPANGGSMVVMQRVQMSGGQAQRLVLPQGVPHIPPAATPAPPVRRKAPPPAQ